MVTDGFEVSVVIPAFNEAARIAAAIDCVRAQTLPAAEIVVVDDGSSDATAAVAEARGARVVRKPNGGLSSARNAGVRAARGTWVAFLDADDRWWPEKLAQARDAHAAEPTADLIFSDYRVVYDGVRALGPALAAIPQYRPVKRRAIGPDCLLLEPESLVRALVEGNFLLTSTLVVRRDFVVDHALWYDESLPATPEYHTSEDIEWFLRAVRRSRVLLIERILTDYHRHSGNMSGSAGRLKYGDVKLGERVLAAPALYGETTAALFRAVRPAHLRESAVLHMRGLEFARARAVALQAWRERPTPFALALVVLAACGQSSAGRSLARLVRTLWRARSIRRAGSA